MVVATKTVAHLSTAGAQAPAVTTASVNLLIQLHAVVDSNYVNKRTKMKYVILTEANSEGISEVFHVIVLPEDQVPAGMIDRWNSITEASPMTVLTVSGKENLAIHSVLDEESETFTMGEGVPAEAAKPMDIRSYVFLINNVVTGMFSVSAGFTKFAAAFSAPITVLGLEDDSPVGLGYTYDGTSFSAPEDI